MVAAFALSAIVQYNDPDPLGWMAIYAAAAAAGIAWRRWPFALAVGLVAAAWAAALAPQALPGLRPGDLVKTMHAGTPSIELGRELLGLVLVAGWMAVLVSYGRLAARRARTR
jgi:hypothetical protein